MVAKIVLGAIVEKRVGSSPTILNMKTSKDYAKRQLYRKFEIPRQIIKLITTNKILNIDIKNKYGRYFHN